jgi:lambda repressor-like predicted transcriptional regulator
MTIAGLAAEFGLHPTTVSTHLRRLGKTTRTRGLNQDQANEAAQLYRQGWSTARLGSRYNVSANTINAALRHQGVEIRRPGRPPQPA